MSIISWRQLFDELRIIIESGSLDSPNQKASIKNILERYQSNEEDFKQYLYFHESGYTKNLVEDFGSICNVMVIGWAPNQESAFHSHEGSRCFVKVLMGQLTEQQVPFPSVDQSTEHEPKVKKLTQNQISYIDDSVGLHKVTNESSQIPAATLHIYMPPYIKCRIFPDEKSLESSETHDVTFHSKFGQQIQQ